MNKPQFVYGPIPGMTQILAIASVLYIQISHDPI